GGIGGLLLSGDRRRQIEDGGDGGLGPLLLVPVIGDHGRQRLERAFPFFQPGQQLGAPEGGLGTKRRGGVRQLQGLLQKSDGGQLVGGAGARSLVDGARLMSQYGA